MASQLRKYFWCNTATKSKVEKTVLESPSCNLIRNKYEESLNTTHGVLDLTNTLNCVTRNPPFFLKKEVIHGF